MRLEGDIPSCLAFDSEQNEGSSQEALCCVRLILEPDFETTPEHRRAWILVFMIKGSHEAGFWNH
jgi:hypothetical protein